MHFDDLPSSYARSVLAVLFVFDVGLLIIRRAISKRNSNEIQTKFKRYSDDTQMNPVFYNRYLSDTNRMEKSIRPISCI